ncbi:hypothetical protein SAMN05518849_11868 [Sphingobium sp. AP50]|nr:hypothetical protein [Sphingobium sp. AP50]SEJ92129.1 hypothetical protein SAMN05518849_11868 [Sphingobium sp. AP50]
MTKEASMGQSDIIELGAVTEVTRGISAGADDVLNPQTRGSMGLTDED